MSGHSKWSTIKRKKGAEDSKRGQLFTKLVKDIVIAARHNGGDINANPALRSAVDKARLNNMPKANIERAIAKGAGTLPGFQTFETIYEGYGPSGSAFLIKCITDNKNRTVAEIRHIFNANGFSLGEAGSVSYIFNTPDNKPMFLIDIPDSEIESFSEFYFKLTDQSDVAEIKHNANIDISEDE